MQDFFYAILSVKLDSHFKKTLLFNMLSLFVANVQ